MNYQPKNILLTGVLGFICSYVAGYLVPKYPNIRFIGIDKISYCSSKKNIDKIIELDNFIFEQADITDLEKMNSIFEKYHIDTVMHFAAYTHVDNSFGNSLEFTHNNVVGTHVLLEVAKNSKRMRTQGRFIHVSTDEVYGDKDSISTEDSILEPTNPYSATKASSEHIVKSYYHSFKLPVIITRGNNVYGPHQYPEKVIPRFIQRLTNNQKCQIQGSGQQKRSFMYVGDVARAFECILFNGIIGQIYNVGTDKEYSILDVANMILSILKPEEKADDWIEFVKDREFNDQRYFISSEKLKSLGWDPETNFQKGLQLTVDWYLSHQNHWDFK